MKFDKDIQALARTRKHAMLSVAVDGRHQEVVAGSMHLRGPEKPRSAWVLMYTAVNLSNGEHATVESAFAKALEMWEKVEQELP